MNACLSLVFSILELLSIFGRLDGRCMLYIKAGAASMPVHHVRGTKTGRCSRCVVCTHPILRVYEFLTKLPSFVHIDTFYSKTAQN